MKKRSALSKLLFFSTVSCIVAIISVMLLGCSAKTDDKHTHTFIETVVEPDCTESGYTLHSCSCGESYKDTFVDAVGHTPKAAVKENEVVADCTKEGGYDEVIYCDVCGEKLSIEHKTIDKLAHKYTDGVCDDCGELYYNVEELEFTLSQDGKYYIVSGFNGNSVYANIPDTYLDLPVTSIDEYAFCECENLTRVTMGNNITFIGEGAFSESGITSVTIPNSVTSIGDYAFELCGSLTSVNIGIGVTEIGKYAFDNCISLVSVFWNATDCAYAGCDPDSDWITPIFGDCESLSVVIGETVRLIPAYAFYGCGGLTSVSIPNGVISIGEAAFAACESLTSVFIPNSVTSIGDYAFYGCDELETVYYLGTEDDLIKVNIGDENTSLTNVICFYSETEPAIDGNYWHYSEFGNAEIWEIIKRYTYVFESNGGTALEPMTANSITEQPVTEKQGYYFGGWYDNEELAGKRVSFPYYKYGGATLYAKWLTEEEYENEKTGHKYKDGVCTVCGELHYNVEDLELTLSQNGDHYIVSGFNGDHSYVNIPDSYLDKPITEIGNNAFYGCVDLISASVPNSVISIGKSAFEGCSGLTSVDFGIGVTSIGEYAFYGCRGLTNLTIPKDVTSIGKSAFEGCSGLTCIEIGNSITSIGASAFWSCIKLTSIYYTGNIAEWCEIYGIGSLMNCGSNDKKLYINGDELTELIIPNSITSIGNDAFYGCRSLERITISDGITSIGENAFAYCASLEIVYWNATECTGGWFKEYSGITYIAPVFSDCENLTTAVIGNNVKAIPPYAFKDCHSLKDVSIPYGVNTIGRYAFQHCESLTRVNIPNSVTSIGRYAFSECRSLTNLILPRSVTSIYEAVFENCIGLRTVYYLGTEEDRDKINISFDKLNVLDGNSYLINAMYFYSQDEPTRFVRCWHYDENENMVIWEFTEEQTYVFESNGGTTIETITTSLITELPVPEKEGLYFDGWYENAEFSGEPIVAPYYNDGGATLYAKWITYDEYRSSHKGTSFEWAEKAQSGQTYAVDITNPGQIYYFSFTAPASGTLTVYSSGDLDTYAYLCSSSSTQALTTDNESGSNHNFSISYNITAGTMYYVAVRLYSSAETGSFTVTFG